MNEFASYAVSDSDGHLAVIHKISTIELAGKREFILTAYCGYAGKTDVLSPNSTTELYAGELGWIKKWKCTRISCNDCRLMIEKDGL